MGLFNLANSIAKTFESISDMDGKLDSLVTAMVAMKDRLESTKPLYGFTGGVGTENKCRKG